MHEVYHNYCTISPTKQFVTLASLCITSSESIIGFVGEGLNKSGM